MSTAHPGAHWRQTALALFIASAVIFALTGILHARVGKAEDHAERAPMPVTGIVFTSESGYQREQHFLGLVQAATRSQVGFAVPGTIVSIAVQEGERVTEGQPLASLDTQALQARRSAGAAIVEQIRAELELAGARTQRQTQLKSNGAVSEQLFDDTRLAEKALKSRLVAARAQLRSLDIDLEKSVLRSPYPAQVGRQILDRGAVTQPGAAVFTLVSSARREAHIGVAVEQAQHLKPGEHYNLQWRGLEFSVALRAIRPDVNPVSMTVVAIFNLADDLDAFDGEPLSISLPRQIAETGGWLPLSSLLEGERGMWTVLKMHSAESGAVRAQREVVEVLHVSGDRAFVRGTLNDGDMVIADGVHRIAPGTHVRIAGL
ncbi:MAG: RND family efflux transporter MFP subunit [Halieaceae bacterium]|jgi:RND family efflux transporter MFP subunit